MPKKTLAEHRMSRLNMLLQLVRESEMYPSKMGNITNQISEFYLKQKRCMNWCRFKQNEQRSALYRLK